VAILYVETNFIISIATGRDPQASAILDDSASPLHFVVPGICFFECLSWMQGETKRREGLGRQWGDLNGQLKRDLTSAHAQTLQSHLQQAILENEGLLKHVGRRLFDAIEKLSRRAEILPLHPKILENSRKETLIGELTDNLIVHSILDHARSTPNSPRALLTENSTDFDQPVVKKAMRAAGVIYFRRSDQALAWSNSLGDAGGG
jgi:hypothetical protein